MRIGLGGRRRAGMAGMRIGLARYGRRRMSGVRIGWRRFRRRGVSGLGSAIGRRGVASVRIGLGRPLRRHPMPSMHVGRELSGPRSGRNVRIRRGDPMPAMRRRRALAAGHFVAAVPQHPVSSLGGSMPGMRAGGGPYRGGMACVQYEGSIRSRAMVGMAADTGDCRRGQRRGVPRMRVDPGGCLTLARHGMPGVRVRWSHFR